MLRRWCSSQSISYHCLRDRIQQGWLSHSIMIVSWAHYGIVYYLSRWSLQRRAASMQSTLRIPRWLWTLVSRRGSSTRRGGWDFDSNHVANKLVQSLGTTPTASRWYYLTRSSWNSWSRSSCLHSRGSSPSARSRTSSHCQASLKCT